MPGAVNNVNPGVSAKYSAEPSHYLITLMLQGRCFQV